MVHAHPAKHGHTPWFKHLQQGLSGFASSLRLQSRLSPVGDKEEVAIGSGGADYDRHQCRVLNCLWGGAIVTGGVLIVFCDTESSAGSSVSAKSTGPALCKHSSIELPGERVVVFSGVGDDCVNITLRGIRERRAFGGGACFFPVAIGGALVSSCASRRDIACHG